MSFRNLMNMSPLNKSYYILFRKNMSGEYKQVPFFVPFDMKPCVCDIKWHEMEIILSGYVDSDAEFDNFEQELEYCLQQFEEQLVNDLGVGTFDIITKRIWQHAKPTAEAEGNGWYEDLAVVQGNPLYFTGEAVTGYTVPSVFSWINKNIG